MHEPVTLAGGGLWIQFTWQGDRWGHRIGVEVPGEDRSSASSAAGLSEAGSSSLPLPPGEGRGEGTPREGVASLGESPRPLASATESDRGQRPRLQKRVILESVEGTPNQNWPPSPPLQELHLESRPDGKQLALLVGMAGNSHWSMSVEFDPAAGKALFDVACRVKREPGKLASTYRRQNSDLCVVPTSGPEELPATVRWGYQISPVFEPDRQDLSLEVVVG